MTGVPWGETEQGPEGARSAGEKEKRSFGHGDWMHVETLVVESRREVGVGKEVREGSRAGFSPHGLCLCRTSRKTKFQKELRHGISPTRVQILVLPLPACVSLGRALALSQPLSPLAYQGLFHALPATLPEDQTGEARTHGRTGSAHSQHSREGHCQRWKKQRPRAWVRAPGRQVEWQGKGVEDKALRNATVYGTEKKGQKKQT